MATADPITVARFWSKVKVGASCECWLWHGNLPGRYGKFQTVRAHRFAYELIKGPIPEGLMIRHLCHNKLCCNPKHLEVGTAQDNANDDIDLRLKTGKKNIGNSKLTDDQVRYIRTSGKSGAELAREFGMSESSISYIRSFRSYRFVA